MLYNQPISDVLDQFKTTKDGLTEKEANFRLKQYGPNEIKKEQKFSLLFHFLSQFTDLLAIILIIAGLLSIIIGSFRDAVVIFGIVFLNASIGFFQEFKAEKAIQALKKIVPLETKVIRGGEERKIEVKNIVPGDIVFLSEGDNVPADIRLIEAYNLSTNDFTITGESSPQPKFVGEMKEKNLSLTDINNMIFMGMSIMSGNCVGVVTATGMNTEFGKIAHLTTSIKEELSPLQKDTRKLGMLVAKITLSVISIMILVTYVLSQGRFSFREAFEFSLGTAASLVPEGLPATISIALAIGVQRMAKVKSAIRKLSAVETLGCTTVICTDKTGTITKNEMTAKEIWINNHHIHIKGVGYSSKGDFTLENNKKLTIKGVSELRNLFLIAILANNARLAKDEDKIKIIGDQTEGALLVMAEKAGINTDNPPAHYKKISEIPFDSQRKRMSAIYEVKSERKVFTKGSPLEVLELCESIEIKGNVKPINQRLKDDIKRQVDEFAGSGLRVLAFAYKKTKKIKEYTPECTECDLIFVGLVGIIDPPREDVKDAILQTRKAGIKAIMITGDYSLTSKVIAQRIGLVGENPKIITGTDLNTMEDGELEQVLKNDEIIFARTSPEHKMRIVSLLQQMGEVVAVTGDGVNDAPALKQANVGVAMGITGTDVSKEAAEMVLTNDSFASIVKAIREGRIVYDNLKKFMLYIFSSNASEFFSVVWGLFVGVAPILAIQILFIDLGTDVLPSLALAVDPADGNVMNRPPRDQNEKLLSFKVLKHLLRLGVIASILAVLVFLFVLYTGGWQGGKFWDLGNPIYLRATAATYAVLVICQFVNVFHCRSAKESFFRLLSGNNKLIWSIILSFILLLNVIYNPIFQKFFHTGPLRVTDWLLVLLAAFVFLMAEEVRKRKVNQTS